MHISRRGSKDFLKSQSITKRRRKKKILKVWLGLFFFVCALSVLSYASRIERFSIKNIVIVGNTYTTSTEIESLVTYQIDQMYAGLFSKKNILFIPKHEITELIYQTFPRIKKVDIEVESFNILNIKVEERQAKARWCAAIRCYLVDDSGYIFGEYIEPTENTLIIEDLGDLPVLYGMDDLVGSEAIGAYVFRDGLFNKIMDAIIRIERLGYKIREVHVYSRDEIVFNVSGNGNIILSDRKSFDSSIENLSSSLKSDMFSTSTQFEYIDVRFGNKVFYKLQKGTVTSAGSSTASSSKTR